MDGWWKDAGKPEDLLIANQLVLSDINGCNNGLIGPDVSITGNVIIGSQTEIETSIIRGPVIIGKECKIGPNVYIGPYTSIGNGVEIKNTEIENSIVMENVSINCGKHITDSLIGRNSIIEDSDNLIPQGKRLIIGDQSSVKL